ncbi:hypothetical protein Ddc_03165 [Ditylenchus destructor]|nr:hypothetical protein Ddc_03165 [Ditylenchus destructor]
MEFKLEHDDGRKTEQNLFSTDLLVHIGNAEIQSTLPTHSAINRKLYEQINETEESLSKVRKTVETVFQENATKEEEIKQSKGHIVGLNAQYERTKSRLSENQEECSKYEKEISNVQDENQSMKETLLGVRNKIKHLESQISKRTVTLASLTTEADERIYRKNELNSKLDEIRLAESDIDECIQRDTKIVKDLESYMRKLTKQVYDGQRELDQLRLLKTTEHNATKAKLNNVCDREHFHFPNSLSNESAPSKFSGKTLVPEEDEMNSALEKLTMRRNIVEGNSKIISDSDDERAYLRKQLAGVIEEELRKRFLSTDIDVDTTIKENRLNRLKAKIEELKYEKSPPMYKAYNNALGEIESTFEPQNEGMRSTLSDFQILHDRKADELVALRNKRSQSENFESCDEEDDESVQSSPRDAQLRSENNNFESRTNKSTLNSPEDPSAIQELQEKRLSIFDDCSKEAMMDLEERKRQLNIQIGAFTASIRALCDEIEEIETAIQKKKEESDNIRIKINRTRENRDNLTAESEEKMININKIEKEQLDELEKKINELTSSIEKLETRKNRLHEQILQAQVDENNLRNRYNTFASMKNSKKSGLKELNQVHNLLEQWRHRVESSRVELENLSNFLQLSKSKNRPTREKLATLKPYYKVARLAMEAWWDDELRNLTTRLPKRLNIDFFEQTHAGHFTQMSTDLISRVGCAGTKCPGSGLLFVCHYDRRQLLDRPVYEVGKKCSRCPEDYVCKNSTGLCRPVNVTSDDEQCPIGRQPTVIKAAIQLGLRLKLVRVRTRQISIHTESESVSDSERLGLADAYL